MRIGELAKATDTKAETIRYYEREGILPSADRTASNYRAYGAKDVAALRFVRRARALGFSMAQVRELLALSDHEDKPCANVDQMARVHLAEVERKVADLTALANNLNAMLDACDGKRIGKCRIVESLARRA